MEEIAMMLKNLLMVLKNIQLFFLISRVSIFIYLISKF